MVLTRTQKFKTAIAVLVACLPMFAWAQSLNNAQLQALKNAIVADPALNSYPNTPDGNNALAGCLSSLTTVACPAPGPGAGASFTVWKSNVTITAVGDAINSAELGGLTTANTSRLQAIAVFHPGGFRPADANTRAFFDDIFSGAGGVNTRASLLALWKRLSNRFEKIYATGTGSDASPATLVIEGSVSYQVVEQARALP